MSDAFKTRRGLRGLIRRMAKRLDRVRPGWARKVKVTRLDLASPRRCVLAQVFGGYITGLRELEVDGTPAEDAFLPQWFDDAHPVDLAVDYWKEEIRERRRAARSAA